MSSLPSGPWSVDVASEIEAMLLVEFLKTNGIDQPADRAELHGREPHGNRRTSKLWKHRPDCKSGALSRGLGDG